MSRVSLETQSWKPRLNIYWRHHRLFRESDWSVVEVKKVGHTAVVVNRRQDETADYTIVMKDGEGELCEAAVKVKAIYDERIGYLDYSETLLKIEMINKRDDEGNRVKLYDKEDE